MSNPLLEPEINHFCSMPCHDVFKRSFFSRAYLWQTWPQLRDVAE
jgi:hypothetical protein